MRISLSHLHVHKKGNRISGGFSGQAGGGVGIMLTRSAVFNQMGAALPDGGASELAGPWPLAWQHPWSVLHSSM